MTISVKMAPPVPPIEEGEPGTPSLQGNTSPGRDQAAPNGPRSWERPWTLDEIRREAGSWSLAGDAGLLNMLQEFSQHMIARTHEMEKEVDGLVHEAKLTDIRLSNVTNDFIMLANTQFVENRVYDEDITQEPATEEEKKTEQQEKTREQREAELIPKVTEALKYGIDVIDQAFEKLDTNVDSESEDEDSNYKVDPILEAKDPYLTRALPCLIGSAKFLEDDNVGLMEDITDEEADTDHGSISESGNEKTDEDSETEYSDSEDERHASTTTKTKRVSTSDESDSENGTTESEEDMFGRGKNVDSDEEEVIEDSEEEKGEEEGAEKDMIRQPKLAGDFASELAAKIGASLPKPPPGKAGSDKSDNKDESADEEAAISRKSSMSKVEEKENKKTKQKEKKGKGKSKLVAAAVDDEDGLFGQAGHADDEDEDDLFGKPGGLFSSSKGLFDDDDDDAGGGLFGSVEKPTATKKLKAEPAVEDTVEEPEPPNRQTVASSKKIPKGAVPIFGGKEDNLFTASTRSEERPLERKLTVSSVDSSSSTKAAAKMSGGGGGGGGGLFDDDDEDDLFSTAPKTTQKAAATSAKKTHVTKTDLFGEDNEEDDLFSSMSSSSSKPAATPAKPSESPPDEDKPSAKGKEKKLPAGAVSMFGAAGNPMVAALKKPKPDSDSEEEEDKMAKSSRSSSLKSGDSVPKVLAPAPRTPSLATPASSLFADDEEEDLFAVQTSAKSKSKPKTAPAVPSAQTKEGNSLFSDKEEKEKDVASAKSKTEQPAADTKKSEEKQSKSGSLFGGDEDEDDLFSAVAKPKESGKKKPAGGVALFGGADILGKKNDSESDVPKEEPPALVPVPAAKSTPQKKLVSLFDADEEDEKDLFGPAPTTASAKSAAADSRKERSKSLFDDEDVLFGTTEESPTVDIFSKSPPAPTQQKHKAEPTQPSKDTPASFSKPAKETPAPLTQPPKETPASLTQPPKETPTSLTQPPKKETPASLTQPDKKEKPAPLTQPDKNEKPAPLIHPAKKEMPPLATQPIKETPPLVAGKATGTSATKATSSTLFADDEDDDDLFGVSTKKPTSKTLPIGGVTTAESSDFTAVEEEPPKPAPEPVPEQTPEPAKPKKLAGAVSMFGGLDPAALLKKKPRRPSADEEKDVEREEKSEVVKKEAPAIAEKPAREKATSVSDPLFGNGDNDDLFGKPQPVIVTKPVPILAAKPQRPKVDVPTPPGFGEPLAESSPGEATPKTPQSPKPPLSPPSDSKPFKKPAGGIALFGGLGALAELKKRTASQNEDASPLSETPSDLQSPLSPASSEDLFEEKPRSAVKSASFSKPKPPEGKIGSLQKNLGLNPAALLPGALPPNRDTDPGGVDFDDPADVSTLQSASKDRAKVISRRRPQSRKARKKAALTSGISFEDATTPTSPELPSLPDQELYVPEVKPKVTDLFSNDDLFSEGPSAFKPPVKQAVRQEDSFSKEQLDGGATKAESKPATRPAVLDDDDDNLFSVSKSKPKNQLDIFGDSKPKPATVDLFGNIESKPSMDSQRNVASASSKDADEDGLFSSSSKASSSSTTTKPPKIIVAAEDDDIFADSSLNTKKAKKEQIAESSDSTETTAQTKHTKEDDIFASSTITAASERRRPKKAVTKDETLFKDDTDIFADLPAAKPKENKKKKKTTEKKSVEQKDIDDIFADSSPAAPKSKKKASSTKGATVTNTDNIFDDPLNLAGK